MNKLTIKTIDDIFLFDSKYNIGLHNLLISSQNNPFYLDLADLINCDLLHEVFFFKIISFPICNFNNCKILFYLCDDDMNFIVNEYLGKMFYEY